jgi:ribosomal protein L7Ae-like RNA K-turn-binding protein
LSLAPLYSLLGLAQRAGQVASGETAAELALKKGKGKLALLAEDASERTRQRFLFLAKKAGVPCYWGGDRETLGAAIGKAPRSMVVVTADSFAKGMMEILERTGASPITV